MSKNSGDTGSANQYSENLSQTNQVINMLVDLPLGVVEAQQDSDTIFKGINELIKNGNGKNKVFVYDGSGNILYPYQKNEDEEQTALYYHQIASNRD